MKVMPTIPVVFALLVSIVPGTAHAQNDYPDRPIKMIVGFAAGGGTDVVARLVAQKMTEALHQSVVVENLTGASGMLAAENVAKSPRDGYTLMMGSQTTFAVAPALYRKVTVNPARDFAGISLAGASPLVLAANPTFGAKTVADVIAMAKAAPGKINFGTGGVGTTPHMTAELFEHDADIKMTHVAYRGEAPAINDLLGNHIPMMFANLSAVIADIEAGKLRALAVTGPHRSLSLPDIPTVADTLPGFAAETWFGLVAPVGTPRDVITKLNAVVRAGLADPQTKKRFDELGMSDGTSTPEQLDAYISSEIDKWSKVIEEAKIQASD